MTIVYFILKELYCIKYKLAHQWTPLSSSVTFLTRQGPAKAVHISQKLYLKIYLFVLCSAP